MESLVFFWTLDIRVNFVRVHNIVLCFVAMFVIGLVPFPYKLQCIFLLHLLA